jgi:hypothetical protein
LLRNKTQNPTHFDSTWVVYKTFERRFSPRQYRPAVLEGTIVFEETIVLEGTIVFEETIVLEETIFPSRNQFDAKSPAPPSYPNSNDYFRTPNLHRQIPPLHPEKT